MDNIRSLIESGQGSISFTVTAEALRAYGIAIAQEVLNAQPQEDKTELLTVEEAGDLLKASRTALWRWEKKGILKPIKIGRSVRYRKSDLEALVAKKKGGFNAQPQEDKTELLTVEEAGEVLAPAPTPKHVHGLAGIASLFGCSIPTAYRIKKSGIIDAAITQIGRKIVVDAPKALELAGKKKGGRDE